MTQSQPERASNKDPNVLSVTDLEVGFETRAGYLKAVDGVSFALVRGKTLGVLGESGSGKTVTGDAIMGILPSNARVNGSIQFNGTDLLEASEGARRSIRGEHIAMIFQDPLTTLSPSHSVGFQIAEMFTQRRGMNKKDAKEEARALMVRVGLSGSNESCDAYPHEFSGGMRQRIVIAIAIALQPEVLVADEPTTALDVTVQAQIMDLLFGLQSEFGMALVLITHDLAVIAEAADTVAVMYGGRIVETGRTADVYRNPAHPYTAGLLASLPRVDQVGQALTPIPGVVPSLLDRPSGCSFHPRCRYAIEVCVEQTPPTIGLRDGRASECHRAVEMLAGDLSPEDVEPV